MDHKNADTMLLAGIQSRNESSVRNALENGAHANYRYPGGETPLHYVANLWNTASSNVIDLLIHQGAQVDAKDDEGFTPLMVASLKGYESTVGKLLEKADPAETRLNTKETALHMAMKGNSYDTVIQLLKAGAEVSAKTADGATALHLAAEFGHASSISALVNYVPNAMDILEIKNHESKTPAEVALDNGHQELAHQLDLLGTSKKDCDKAMTAALIKGDPSGLEAALNAGADENHPTPRGDNLLHAPAAKGHLVILRLLLNKGAEVNCVDSLGYSPLMVAALNGHNETVEALLQYKANVKATSKEGETALHLAMVHDSSGVVRKLLDAGANPNALDQDGSTPLHIAAQYDAISSLQELMREVSLRRYPMDNKGDRPIDLAREKKHQQFCRFLENMDEVDGNLSGSQEVTFGNVIGPKDNVYKNLTEPRGHVLVINNTFKNNNLGIPVRYGAQEDSQNLRNLFEKMGYKVETHENQTKDETLKTLRNFRDDPELENIDSIFVFLLSHGDCGKFITEDRKYLDEQKVYDFFKDSQCPHLKGKPKAFVFNFCRGKFIEDRCAKYVQTDSESFGQVTIPEENDSMANETIVAREAPRDMLAMYASTEGIMALREETRGTFFVLMLCRVFAKFAFRDHLKDLATKICDEMEKNDFTTPEIRDFHFKHLYLNPIENLD